MATSIDALVLFVLMMCFYNPAFADSFNRTQTPTNNLPSNHLEAQYSKSNDTTNIIDILYFVIQNDMSIPGAVPYFYYNNTASRYYLLKGKPFAQLADLSPQSCKMYYWDPKSITGPIFCAFFDVYDPKIDRWHHKTFWSVRNDGVYKSYDNHSWDKNKSWTTSGC